MMSNNEEKMRADFERYVYDLVSDVFQDSSAEPFEDARLDPDFNNVCECIRRARADATASKQREIDALNQQLESERIHSSMQFDQIGSLNQQVLELSAMVEKKDEAFAQILELGKGDAMHYAHEIAHEAISISPSAALRDYVNEEVAKALEELLEEHRRFPHDGIIRIVEAALNERRNRK